MGSKTMRNSNHAIKKRRSKKAIGSPGYKIRWSSSPSAQTLRLTP